MPLTEEEYFDKGAKALKLHITKMQEYARFQISSMREHYETGHNGKHKIPKDNTPIDMFYKIMGENMLDVQPLRQSAPHLFERIELVYWINSALAFATVREDTKWAAFEKDMLEGIDAFVARQLRDVGKPTTRTQIIQTGMMIARMEAETGKSFEEVMK